MNYKEAVAILNAQNRSIRKVNNVRFTEDGYEYRVTYHAGFAPYVTIDRRKEGKRNFCSFNNVSVHHCLTVGDVMKLVMEKVRGET